MSKRVVAFGEVMMRLEVPGYALLAQGDSLSYSFSGTGVNVASAMTRLGHSGALVTKLPDNSVGDAAFAWLQRLGIDPALIERSGAYLGMYFLENGFGTRPSKVTYTNRLESSFNTAEWSESTLESIAAQTDLLHVDGIALAMTDRVRDNMKALARKVKDHGGQVCFDCNFRPSLWGERANEAKGHYEDMLAMADIVFMNEKDALNTLGLTSRYTDRADQLEELIPQVADKYAISVIAGTHRTVHSDNRHSIRGYLWKAGRFAYAEPPAFAVHDRIGSGDAFASGILHGELTKLPAEDTVAFAATSNILACTITGDTPMATVEDIRQAMRGHTTDVSR
ncbi:sugar kinase [Aureibacillus halotolerans]|uniref:2-dehydro-3-deoxygluconokinase n=1 Tax=Aureibacillus halotolerans TaxID=1508390 RepID=A0A4R6U415_9BACI|nr:sugar kinase [Aureibacillus halotolerans]TDQ40821.1 2-dehydro-3-deoxygluconokinase [Aureibacillus halotolerans]